MLRNPPRKRRIFLQLIQVNSPACKPSGMEHFKRGRHRSIPFEDLQHPQSRRHRTGDGSPVSCKENDVCNSLSSSEDRSGMLIFLSAHTDRFTCLYCRINFLCEKHLLDHMNKYHGYVRVSEGGEPGESTVPCQKMLEAADNIDFREQSPEPYPPAVPTTVSSAGILTDKTQVSHSQFETVRRKPYHRPLIMTLKINRHPSSQTTRQPCQLFCHGTQQKSSQMMQQASQSSILSPPVVLELCTELDSSKVIDVVF